MTVTDLWRGFNPTSCAGIAINHPDNTQREGNPWNPGVNRLAGTGKHTTGRVPTSEAGAVTPGVFP
jgi:hypothetical protein